MQATAEAAGCTAELPDMQYITALAGLDPSSHLFGADIVIVDPPRKGLEASVLQALCTQSEQEQDGTGLAAPHTLVYLSCGFPALKRDCDTLLAGGWRLASAKAFIFFPGTDAIETLAIFTR